MFYTITTNLYIATRDTNKDLSITISTFNDRPEFDYNPVYTPKVLRLGFCLNLKIFRLRGYELDGSVSGVNLILK